MSECQGDISAAFGEGIALACRTHGHTFTWNLDDPSVEDLNATWDAHVAAHAEDVQCNLMHGPTSAPCYKVKGHVGLHASWVPGPEGDDFEWPSSQAADNAVSQPVRTERAPEAEDAEIAAMRRLVAAMNAIPIGARGRVLRWVVERWEV